MMEKRRRKLAGGSVTIFGPEGFDGREYDDYLLWCLCVLWEDLCYG